jgi:DNA replication protein DnaC
MKTTNQLFQEKRNLVFKAQMQIAYKNGYGGIKHLGVDYRIKMNDCKDKPLLAINEKTNRLYDELTRYFFRLPGGKLDKRKGIYLLGKSGIGKTKILEVFRHALKRNLSERRLQIEPIPILMNQFKRKQKYDHQKLLKGEVIFDDFGLDTGKIQNFGNELNILDEILFSRHKQFTLNGLRTHFTSNIPIESEKVHSLADNMDLRIVNRIRNMVQVVYFDSDPVDNEPQVIII